MYYSLAALAAALISIMVAVNGGLAAAYGLHVSVLLIHLVGLLVTSAAVAVKKAKPFAIAGLPAALFSGGAIGYLTTLFNNMAAGKISVTAILALSLLGQAVISLVIDQFGLFGMPVRKFRPTRLAGLAMVSAGIVFLLSDAGGFASVPALVSLLTGLTVVISRSINAQLSERTSLLVGTWYNYAAGVAASAAALLIAAAAGAAVLPPAGAFAGAPLWAYLGGAIGAVVVSLSNLCVSRMSSLAMTLVMFAGQVFGGVAVDAVLFGEFSWRSLAGGVFAFCGLVLNLLPDALAERKKAACTEPGAEPDN